MRRLSIGVSGLIQRPALLFMVGALASAPKLPACRLSFGRTYIVRHDLAVPSFALTFAPQDEPTSGLDSHAAMNVMKLTRGLCDQQGQTVVCSIHQPRPGIYKMFDQLLLLHQGRNPFLFVFSNTATRT